MSNELSSFPIGSFSRLLCEPNVSPICGVIAHSFFLASMGTIL